MDGGWMPLPTRPQRYCDPASLISRDLSFDETEIANTLRFYVTDKGLLHVSGESSRAF